MAISLTQFCKDYSLAKTSVYRRCKDLDIDTSDGLTDEAVVTLKLEFGVIAMPDSFDVEAELVENPPTAQMVQAGMSLAIPGMETSAVTPITYSTEALVQARDNFQQRSQVEVGNLADVINAYAKYRAVQTMQEIDATFEGLKSAALGKSVGATVGEAVSES